MSSDNLHLVPDGSRGRKSQKYPGLSSGSPGEEKKGLYEQAGRVKIVIVLPTETNDLSSRKLKNFGMIARELAWN